MTNPLYYASADEQRSWIPDDWYTLYRYLDRMFSSDRGTREQEITSLDPARMTINTKYLIFHLLVLQNNLRRMMRTNPNLQPIIEDKRDGLLELSDPPLVLTDPPRHAFDYFKRNDIWL